MKRTRYYWNIKTGMTGNWKIQKLSDKAFRLFMIMMDFAAEADTNGTLCSENLNIIDDKSLKNRSLFTAKKFQKSLKELFDFGFIEIENGIYKVCNYSDYQPELASSTKRVRKMRERQKALQSVTCNASMKHERNDIEEKRKDKDIKDKEKSNKKEKQISLIPEKRTVAKMESADSLKPSDVSQETWDDYKILRKAKKAPITKTVLKQLRKKAEDFNYTLDEAMQECCENGWQGFFPKKKKVNPAQKFATKDYGVNGKL